MTNTIKHDHLPQLHGGYRRRASAPVVPPLFNHGVAAFLLEVKMYGKIFESLYEGSMVGAGPTVFAVWGYCIAKADRGGIVILNPALLAPIIGTSRVDIERAIEYLESPDPNSKNPEHEGRRLLHMSGYAYTVVSHAIYRGMNNGEDRREYMREYMRKRRGEETVNSLQSLQKLTTVNPVSASACVSVSDRDGVQGKGKGKGEASDAAGKLSPENFSERAEAANGGRLTEQQLEAFCDYWTERDPKGRCRFQGERYFELPRRIATWARRDRVAPAPAAAKPERPVWQDCALRCRHWDAEKRWCAKYVKTEPKSCEQCKEF